MNTSPFNLEVVSVFTGKMLRKVFFLIKRSTFLIVTKAVTKLNTNTQHLVTVRHHRRGPLPVYTLSCSESH